MATRATHLAAGLQRWLRRHGIELSRFGNVYAVEPLLGRTLRALGTEVVLDVGANEGQTVVQLRRLGFAGRIVSFEPSADAFARLERAHRGDPRWAGHRLALGDASGEAGLHRFADHTLNSLHRPGALLTQEVETTETVPLARLDEVWDELVPAGRAFLKTDTQGHDLSVLRGAGAMLSRVDGVLAEVSINSIYDQPPTLAAVMAELEDGGFELAGLVPGTRDPQNVRFVEANVVYVRSSRLPPLGG